jgi:hypothetical protein
MLSTFSFVCGLLLAALTAQAQVGGGTWTSYSPSFRTQERGCGDISNLLFRLICSTSSGDQRAERRYETYSSGIRQFEGFFRIVSLPGSRISLKQTFKTTGPYFLLAVERSGRLYRVGGDTIGSHTIGSRVRVNTIHQVGRNHQVYINSSLRQTMSSPSGSFYDKFGAYRTSSGRGPATVEWSGIRFFRR